MSIDQGLELIRQKFLIKLQGLVLGFEAFASRLEEQTSDKDDMTEQRIFVHQIAGSARTFGFSETSELAARAEEFIERWAGLPSVATGPAKPRSTCRARSGQLRE